MEIFISNPFSPDSISGWFIIIICAFLIGMAKAGIAGTGMIVIPLLAQLYGGKASSGFLLPILIIADIAAVIYYNRHARWDHIFRLMPWTVTGVIAGTWVGDAISDQVFTLLLTIFVIGGVLIMLWRDSKKEVKVPSHWSVAAILGFLGGFTTMVGNAAGPVLALYLLSMKLPKNNFIGTAAWFFFIINVIKVPFHVFVWHTISTDSFVINLSLAPAIIGGIFLGIWIVKFISNTWYRYFIMATLVLSIVFLFV